MMIIKYSLPLLGAVLLLLTACEDSEPKEATTANATAPMAANAFEDVSLPGADILAFGPDNVLFVGDSKNATVHAIETEATELKQPIPYNLEGLDALLAKKIGVDSRDIIVNDMKIHPLSQEAYISLKKGHAPGAESMIAIINPMTSEIRFLAATPANSTKVAINNPASEELKLWGETPASSLTITDMDYHDGMLYVAGLTNGEFASNVRKINYPFDGAQAAVNSVEIYHAVHTQMETRAPIRTMLFEELNGVSTLVASYTCTPLVTIPAEEIKQEASIKGKTIAELGYGNTPIDMLVVQSQGFDGSISKSLLVTNKNRGGSLIPFASLEAGASGKGMVGMRAMAPTGLDGMTEIPTANVMQIDVQNAQFLAVLRRNIDTGAIDLVSEMTGVYLRLSDFIAEYDFPDYRYPEAQEGTKKYHDMTKKMEGYPEMASEEMGRN